MGTKDRLLLYLQYERLSQAKFEKRCGLSNGYVNNIKVSISPKKLQSISLQFPMLNTGWLLTGEGNILKTHIVSSSTKPETYTTASSTGVPYFDVDFATNFDAMQSMQSPFSIDVPPFNSS